MVGCGISRGIEEIASGFQGLIKSKKEFPGVIKKGGIHKHMLSTSLPAFFFLELSRMYKHHHIEKLFIFTTFLPM